MIEQPIQKITNQGVYFTSDTKKIIDGGFVMPTFSVNTSFIQGFSLALNEFGRIATDDFGQTSYPRIYAAGDSHAAFAEQLVHAASSGSKVASGIVREVAFANFGSFE